VRQIQPSPQSQDIVHPTCAECGAPMWLTRIEPRELGSEKRTLECQVCQNETIEVVKYR
jgi:DNA-directed RNA polymerase subunit RPC12/RpoP